MTATEAAWPSGGVLAKVADLFQKVNEMKTKHESGNTFALALALALAPS